MFTSIRPTVLLGTVSTTTSSTKADNCNGGLLWFSRIFGDLTNGASVQFDPSYGSTLLSDGRLNSSDAPICRRVKIVLNSSSGGMGGFDDSCLNDKSAVYNRNFDAGNPAELHR